MLQRPNLRLVRCTSLLYMIKLVTYIHKEDMQQCIINTYLNSRLGPQINLEINHIFFQNHEIKPYTTRCHVATTSYYLGHGCGTCQGIYLLDDVFDVGMSFTIRGDICYLGLLITYFGFIKSSHIFQHRGHVIESVSG